MFSSLHVCHGMLIVRNTPASPSSNTRLRLLPLPLLLLPPLAPLLFAPASCCCCCWAVKSAAVTCENRINVTLRRAARHPTLHSIPHWLDDPLRHVNGRCMFKRGLTSCMLSARAFARSSSMSSLAISPQAPLTMITVDHTSNRPAMACSTSCQKVPRAASCVGPMGSHGRYQDVHT